MLAAIIIAAIIFGPKVLRVYKMIHLYDEEKIVYNFLNMNKVFPSTPIQAAINKHSFTSKPFNLPEFYELDDVTYSLEEALEYFRSDGMVVLHQGALVYENYWLGNSADQAHISWSVAKSFLSALIGIAYDEGRIDDLNDPISKYLLDFIGTGYEGVSIKDILQMSSGIEFNEDYAD